MPLPPSRSLSTVLAMAMPTPITWATSPPAPPTVDSKTLSILLSTLLSILFSILFSILLPILLSILFSILFSILLSMLFSIRFSMYIRSHVIPDLFIHPTNTNASHPHHHTPSTLTHPIHTPYQSALACAALSCSSCPSCTRRWVFTT